ncbi:MAG: hypothetical protein KA792_01000 [Bacteroidales bacterium]|nr:hypothetical protein [Bacteroidales bacterium]
MNNAISHKIELYNKYFEEIFKDFIIEGNNVIVEFDYYNDDMQDSNIFPEIVSFNNCKTLIDFELMLLLIREKAIKNLNASIKNYIPVAEKKEFLTFIYKKAEIFKELMFINNDRQTNKVYAFFRDYKLKDRKGQIVSDFDEFSYIKNNLLNDEFFLEQFNEYCLAWLKCIITLKCDIASLIKSLDTETLVENVQSKERNNKTSYEWIDSAKDDTKVRRLFNDLKNGDFIDEETKLSDFRAIFSGNSKEPVVWTGEAGVSEIIYLLYLLWGEKEGMEKFVLKPAQPWKYIENCFCLKEGKLNIKSVKSLYSKYKNQNIDFPVSAEKLERIVSLL